MLAVHVLAVYLLGVNVVEIVSSHKTILKDHLYLHMDNLNLMKINILQTNNLIINKIQENILGAVYDRFNKL